MDIFAYNISNLLENLNLGFVYWRYQLKCNAGGCRPLSWSRIADLTGIDKYFLSKVNQDKCGISLKNFLKVYSCLYDDLIDKNLI